MNNLNLILFTGYKRKINKYKSIESRINIILRAIKMNFIKTNINQF